MPAIILALVSMSGNQFDVFPREMGSLARDVVMSMMLSCGVKSHIDRYARLFLR